MSFDIIQLAPLAIVLPFLGAALSLVLVHRNRAQRFVAIVSLSLTLLAECLVLATAWESAPTSINVAGWQAPFGIVLVVDQLSAIMLVVSTLVSLAVLHPIPAAIIAGILLIVMIVIFFLALAKIRKGLRALRRWVNRQPGPDPMAPSRAG